MASTLIECEQELASVRMQLDVWRIQEAPAMQDRYGVASPSPTVLVADLEDVERELECFMAYLEGRACYISHAPL